MDALRVAAPLARLLLALSEAGREGELSLQHRGQSARLSIARGRLVGLRGVEVRPLGDALLALGALHVDSQRSLLRAPAATPIGARLVAAGATSSAAVLRALELQLSDGVDALLRWPSSKISLQRTPLCTRGVATVDLTSAVWSSLFALTASLPAATIAQLAGVEPLRLRVMGARRVRGLLHASESGALAASQARQRLGSDPGSLPSLPLRPNAASIARALAGDPQPAELPLRALLRVLGIAQPELLPATSPHAYALLLRKTRELARNASANVLLDLPASASSASARQALRRLAHKLHPDRFQAGDARLYALSHRVMGALAQAERTLRTSASA
ncbi:MAG: hypothetical protein JWN48_1545 [Myxococcaceae bacterium]|nr:hypothetical protein [Myxococcaceae bacterium]